MKSFFVMAVIASRTIFQKCLLIGITFCFGVGGDHKMNSSSAILKDWQYTSDERVWGKFYNLFQDDRVKVKELILEPGKGMSFQRHQKRNEIWKQR